MQAKQPHPQTPTTTAKPNQTHFDTFFSVKLANNASKAQNNLNPLNKCFKRRENT